MPAVALDAGNPDLAANCALAATAAADEVGAPVEAALAQTLAGRALAEGGQADRAVAELEHAASRLHECGALRYRGAAERELRRLGRRTYRRTSRGIRRYRRRSADGAGAPGRAARGRSPDKSRDSRSALPQSKDRRDAHAKHLPQARRRVARRS